VSRGSRCHAAEILFWMFGLHAAPFRHFSARPACPYAAACFLLASALSEPRDLAISRLSKRAMRSTDVCHPNVNVYPYLARFWLLHGLRRAESSRSLGSKSCDQSIGRFTTPENALRRVVLEIVSVGVFFPRHSRRPSLSHPCRAFRPARKPRGKRRQGPCNRPLVKENGR
jgi:hypothetical protein